MNPNITQLPYGWIQQYDQQTGQSFFVDTKAHPPRSIWTHPYEDDQFLNQHPDVREKVRGQNRTAGSDNTHSSSLHVGSSSDPRRHSYNGKATEVTATQFPKKKQGFFDKLKSKAITSMEERNERKRQQMAMMHQHQPQGMFGPGQYQYSGSRFAPPQQAYPGGMMGMQSGRRRGGGGGMALPLMGGLAGGMLLGNMMDNDHDGYGGGGDYGDGGDFGGGDFGGGDF